MYKNFLYKYFNCLVVHISIYGSAWQCIFFQIEAFCCKYLNVNTLRPCFYASHVKRNGFYLLKQNDCDKKLRMPVYRKYLICKLYASKINNLTLVNIIMLMDLSLCVWFIPISRKYVLFYVNYILLHYFLLKYFAFFKCF